MTIVKNFQFAFIVVALLWAIHLINIFLPIDLRVYGLRPRYIEGLWGIVVSPFLHGNFQHLIANTGALFILLAVALSFSRKLTVIAILIVCIMGGGLVWIFGQSNSVHIGASGVIFGLIGYLMFIGIFRREWKALIISLVIFLFYGGALFSLLMYIPGVSWTGHIFGFLSGILAAWCLRTEKSK